MEKHYVSNKDESARMFKSDLIERFSYVHPLTPHVVFLPFLFWLLSIHRANGLGLVPGIGLFAFGIFFWTLLEYVLHRFVFHIRGDESWQKRLYFLIHGVHHDYPRDSRRLVMPPSASIPMSIPFFFLYRAAFGPIYFPAILAGSTLGYLLYDTMHFAVHHFRPRTKLGAYLRQQHMRHHYIDPDKNFGVTSPLWDFVFGTFLKSVVRAEADDASPDLALLHR